MLEKRSQVGQRLAAEQQTFARPLGSLVQRAPVTCTAERTLAEVAALMRAEGVGSVVIVDARSRPVGIVTTHDMVRVAAERSGERPVAEAMSRDLVALPAHALAYEAAVTMQERRIRHVLVTAEGRLAGVVSERDLFSLQRLGLGEITMELRLATGIPALAGLAAEIRKLIGLLVEQGVSAEQLTVFASVLNDRLAQRAIELARKRCDLGRLQWCWLAFGSEGRFEQTLATDQDNGLVFAAHDGTPPAEARSRLLPFAREVNEALDACGFPLCKGNVMASNPELCLSLEEWQAKMAGWIDVSMPKALMDAAIFFDFRALHGDATLVVALREWLAARVKRHPVFLRHMAEAALQARPGLTRLGGFALHEAPGALPHSLDLKIQGARIFVDVARIYGLAHGLAQTGTVERLRATAAARVLGEKDAAAWVNAFNFIQHLRLRGQTRDGPDAGGGGNRVNPDALDAFERRALKEGFRQAATLQERLRLDYQL